MSKFQFDVVWERLPLNIKDGDDVTHHFKDDICPPAQARVLEAQGPAGGNPFIEFSWVDDDQAYAWAIECGMIDGEEDLEIFRA